MVELYETVILNDLDIAFIVLQSGHKFDLLVFHDILLCVFLLLWYHPNFASQNFSELDLLLTGSLHRFVLGKLE